ncbi:head GIN domain-containing protein [Bacteroidota bacterium]
MKTRMNIVIGLILATLIFTSCEYDMYYITGGGGVVSETLEVDEFTGINMMGAEDVVISYGDVQEVTVIGHANIIDRIKTSVYNGTWDMELERGHYRDYELRYFITVPQINEIKNHGAAKVIVNDFENEGDLLISINGAGDIELNRMENTENLYVSIDGVGRIEAKGEFPSLQYLDIFITGSGSFLGYPAETSECLIEIEGSARCEVSVIDQLEVFISGAGLVRYRGNPSVYQNISGFGVIENKN